MRIPSSAGRTRRRANLPSESRIAIGCSLGATTWLGIRCGTVERLGSAVTSLVIPTQKFAALPPGGAGGALPGTPGSNVVIPGPYRPVHGRSAPGRLILPRRNGGLGFMLGDRSDRSRFRSLSCPPFLFPPASATPATCRSPVGKKLTAHSTV